MEHSMSVNEKKKIWNYYFWNGTWLWNRNNQIHWYVMKKIEDDVRKKHAPLSDHIVTWKLYGEAKLEPIAGLDGCMTRLTTEKNRD